MMNRIDETKRGGAEGEASELQSEIRTEALDHELHPGWSRAQPEHIPMPTYWPAAAALGITLVAWGVVTTPIISGVGLVIFGIALGGWIGEMRDEHREH